MQARCRLSAGQRVRVRPRTDSRGQCDCSTTGGARSRCRSPRGGVRLMPCIYARDATRRRPLTWCRSRSATPTRKSCFARRSRMSSARGARARGRRRRLPGGDRVGRAGTCAQSRSRVRCPGCRSTTNRCSRCCGRSVCCSTRRSASVVHRRLKLHPAGATREFLQAWAELRDPVARYLAESPQGVAGPR